MRFPDIYCVILDERTSNRYVDDRHGISLCLRPRIGKIAPAAGSASVPVSIIIIPAKYWAGESCSVWASEEVGEGKRCLFVIFTIMDRLKILATGLQAFGVLDFRKTGLCSKPRVVIVTRIASASSSIVC